MANAVDRGSHCETVRERMDNETWRVLEKVDVQASVADLGGRDQTEGDLLWMEITGG